MERRKFLAASCVAGLAPLANVAAAADAKGPGKKQYLELRLYEMDAAKVAGLDEFLKKAAIPAWNRIGIGPVGVFKFPEGKGPNVYVLLAHDSLESVAGARAKLMADKEYLKAGATFLNATKKDPAFKRITSQLMLAFDAAPKVENAVKDASRIFQLRIYESHCDERAIRKIEMFNGGGEIDLFRKCGMQPVFFGESIIGTLIPNLTYMVVFPNQAAKDANWKKFMQSPEWKKLSRDAKYKDTVSNITNIVLRPAKYSQL